MNASSSVGSGSSGVRTRARSAGRRADRDQPALADDAQPVAVFRLVHEMAGDQHGDAGVGQRADARPELAARQRIDAGGRFVEEQDVRPVQQRRGQRQALLQAERQFAGDAVGDVAQFEPRQARRRCAAPAPRGPGRRRGRRSAGSPAPTARHRARSAAPCSRCGRAPRRGRAADPAPATRALPPDGRSRPHSMRKMVDLPAPFGPSRPKISPRATAKLTWSTAVKSPKRRTRSRTSIAGPVRRPALRGGGCGHRCACDRGSGVGRRRSRSTNPSSNRGGSGVQRSAAEVRRRPAAPRPSRSTMRSASPCDHRVQHRRVRRGLPRRGTAPSAGNGQAEHPALQRREELGRRRVGQQPALMQQQHAAAARRLVEIGGGPDHAHALGAALRQHRRDDRPELAARCRIDADRRLVQQQQARARQQRAGQAELLLHAAGQLARPAAR